MRHFIDGAVAPLNSLRRMIGIGDVACAVVVDIAHVDDRTLWKKHLLGIVEDGLPVEIPVRNADEGFRGAIGKRGGGGEFFSQIVSMRINGEEIYVDGYGERVGHQKIGYIGRNVQSEIILKLEEDGEFPGRLIGEINANAGFN